MKWFAYTLLGIVLNCFGLYFFSDAVIHRAMANGALAAGFFSGLIALVLINLGICLIAEGARWRGRD
jgi:hypothetical protein